MRIFKKTGIDSVLILLFPFTSARLLECVKLPTQTHNNEEYGSTTPPATERGHCFQMQYYLCMCMSESVILYRKKKVRVLNETSEFIAASATVHGGVKRPHNILFCEHTHTSTHKLLTDTQTSYHIG